MKKSKNPLIIQIIVAVVLAFIIDFFTKTSLNHMKAAGAIPQPKSYPVSESQSTSENMAETIGEVSANFVNSLNYSDIPEYSGLPYTYINSGIPFFTASEKANPNNKPIYRGFDENGRTLSAQMLVSKDTLTNRKRDDISGIHPSGWHQKKYNESIVEGTWSYQRCHLLAHVLGGADIAENLITGTPYLNIEGMWPIEETVKNYVSEHPNSYVLYRVSPIYNDVKVKSPELLARGVLIEASSLDDEFNLCVFCYNVEPYLYLDYSTGQNALTAPGN